MVEQFKRILQEIESRRGSVTLFALIKMDEVIDKWTVVISASWAADENRATVFEEVRSSILNILSQEEILEISRIGVYPKEEHLIQELLQYNSGAELNNKKINGNIVHRAIIIASNPD